MLPTERPGLGYRAHLDGLRGVAIVLVVLHHAGVPGFGVGFIGVDLFFVLSGFLIVGLVRTEIETTDRVSWLSFFGRRCARLLPALLLLIGVLSVVSLVLFSPGGERQAVAKALLASLAFLGNVHYWKLAPASYFSPGTGPGELVLHTWSLGVEEQFYLLLPVGLAFAAWLSRRVRVGFTTVVSVLLMVGTLSSVGVAAWLAQSHAAAGFYMLPARAYELGAGALLAWMWTPRDHRNGVARLAGLAGLLALAACFVLDVPEDAYPGLWGLLPVTAGIGLIVGGPLLPGVGRLLTTRLLVGAGVVSYGWYLWHWPMLVLADVLYVAPSPTTWRVGVVLLALAIAVVSHRWWETPLRHLGRRRPAAALLVGAAAAVAVALVPLGIGAHAKFVGPSGSWKEFEAERTDFFELPQRCLERPVDGVATMRAPLVPCQLTSPSVGYVGPQVLVWGDSHAWAWLPAVLAAVGTETSVTDVSYPGCAPGVITVADAVAGVDEAVRASQEACAASNEDVLRQIDSELGRGDVVVMAARWAVQLGSEPYSLADQPLLLESSDWRVDARTVRSDITEAVARVVAAGAEVVVVRPVPELRRSAPQCLRSIFMGEDCNESLSDHVLFAADANAFISRLDAMEGVHVIDPIPAMCDGDTCPVEQDGVLRYFDDDHISASFSRAAAPLFDDVLRLADAGKRDEHVLARLVSGPVIPGAPRS